jgi:DNA end-binding protein Ku
MAAKAFRVTGEATARENKVGIGRVTISTRAHMVLVEPRGVGLGRCTLQAGDEVRRRIRGDIDAEMSGIAETTIKRKTATFHSATFRDRYRDALRELVEAKFKGMPFEQRPVAKPPKVINLREALKRSLAEPRPEERTEETKPARSRAGGDRCQ